MTTESDDFEADIRACVSKFYEAARADDLIGPIFESIIKDWAHHYETMNDFWSNALLGTTRYSSAPFPPHVKIAMDQRHFDRWGELWAPAVEATLPEPLRTKALSIGGHMTHCWGRAHAVLSRQLAEV